jgi:hypothetical protein
MAPRVDRPVVRASPPGGARFADLARVGRETDQRPGKKHRNRSNIRTGGSCHSSRVKVHAPGDRNVVGTLRNRLGGRLAQLVRALP